jgi:hypothetical protein
MFNRYFLPFFTVLAIAAGLNILGEGQALYAKFFWYDIMMHAIGGAWAALLALWLFKTFRIPARHILLCAIAVGIGWEILEIWLGFMYVSEPGYAIDTAMDLCMDAIGAIAVIAINKKIS